MLVFVVVVLEFADLFPALTLVVVWVVPFAFVDVLFTVEVFAGVVAAGLAVLAGLVLVLFAAVFVFDSPGQAAPNKPNVKTAERAITFFIRLYSPVFFKESIFT